MKKTVITLMCVFLSLAAASGQEYSCDVRVSDLAFSYPEERTTLQVEALLDFSAVEAAHSETMNFNLVIFSGEDQVSMPVGSLLGRGRFYHFARERRTETPFRPEEHVWLWKDVPSPLHFVATTSYEPWMEQAYVRIDCEEGGCCGRPGSWTQGRPIPADIPAPEPEKPVYKPAYIYVLPPAETTVKQRDISGEAYVVFASGKTAVDPSYKDNERELGKIRATIDSVRLDADVTITQVLLRGYSSPDGKEAVNARLAAERTTAIKDYVVGLYTLPDSVFASESVAENWAGLRAAVDASDFAVRGKMLAVIDGPLSADRKEARLKSAYPKQWKALVADVFPLLRRTDYKVSYTVRSYTTAEDARRIMRTHPDKLSIQEFFLAAQGYEMGTRAFDEVFAIAARVYPYNDVVNINAASAALSLGNFQSAHIYLDRAGDSPEACYTRGVCCALEEDWEGAVRYFAKAKAAGVPEAGPALAVAEQLR